MAVSTTVFSVTLLLLLLVSLPLRATGSIRGFGSGWDPLIRLPADAEDEGTNWAVLVAGSDGFENYRHQSDVCHAYQLLKNGGLKDENIVVIMYDDIADHPWNPKPGIIINSPDGDDVYHGVPKDYTGEYATTENFFAVLLGDKSAVKGGSGKVVNSNSNDRIFIYYSDHGGAGVLGMPSGPYLYANDLIEVLKKKFESKTYKEMVIYVDACESGSIFEALLPVNWDTYVLTAANPSESSYATYCPGTETPPPEGLPCLSDMFSAAWMLDSENTNRKEEKILQQFWTVVYLTSGKFKFAPGSHVMQYGNQTMNAEKVYLYQGFIPANENITSDNGKLEAHMDAVDQRSADLFFLWHKYNKMQNNKEERAELLRKITDTMLHRTHLDGSMNIIEAILFGPGKSPSVLNFAREKGLPIVDDWDCLKSMVRIFETHCGSLTQHGMKHMRAFANICNNKVSRDTMEEACKAACGGRDLGNWSPMIRGFSA